MFCVASSERRVKSMHLSGMNFNSGIFKARIRGATLRSMMAKLHADSTPKIIMLNDPEVESRSTLGATISTCFCGNFAATACRIKRTYRIALFFKWIKRKEIIC